MLQFELFFHHHISQSSITRNISIQKWWKEIWNWLRPWHVSVPTIRGVTAPPELAVQTRERTAAAAGRPLLTTPWKRMRPWSWKRFKASGECWHSSSSTLTTCYCSKIPVLSMDFSWKFPKIWQTSVRCCAKSRQRAGTFLLTVSLSTHTNVNEAIANLIRQKDLYFTVVVQQQS